MIRVAQTSIAATAALEPLEHLVDLVGDDHERRHHLQRRLAVEREDRQQAVARSTAA